MKKIHFLLVTFLLLMGLPLQSTAKKVVYLNHQYDGKVKQGEPMGKGKIKIGDVIIKGIFNGTSVTEATINTNPYALEYIGDLSFDESDMLTLKKGSLSLIYKDGNENKVFKEIIEKDSVINANEFIFGVGKPNINLKFGLNEICSMFNSSNMSFNIYGLKVDFFSLKETPFIVVDAPYYMLKMMSVDYNTITKGNTKFYDEKNREWNFFGSRKYRVVDGSSYIKDDGFDLYYSIDVGNDITVCNNYIGNNNFRVNSCLKSATIFELFETRNLKIYDKSPQGGIPKIYISNDISTLDEREITQGIIDFLNNNGLQYAPFYLEHHNEVYVYQINSNNVIGRYYLKERKYLSNESVRKKKQQEYEEEQAEKDAADEAESRKLINKMGFNPLKMHYKEVVTVGRKFSDLQWYYSNYARYTTMGTFRYTFKLSSQSYSSTKYHFYINDDWVGTVWVSNDKISSVSWHR